MFFKRQLSSEKRKKSVNFFYLNLHCTGKGYSVKKHNCRPKTFFKKMPSLRKTANGPSFIYRTMTMGFFVTTTALQICYISSIWKKITTFVSIIWTMEIHSLICIWHRRKRCDVAFCWDEAFPRAISPSQTPYERRARRDLSPFVQLRSLPFFELRLCRQLFVQLPLKLAHAEDGQAIGFRQSPRPISFDPNTGGNAK